MAFVKLNFKFKTESDRAESRREAVASFSGIKKRKTFLSAITYICFFDWFSPFGCLRRREMRWKHLNDIQRDRRVLNGQHASVRAKTDVNRRANTLTAAANVRFRYENNKRSGVRLRSQSMRDERIFLEQLRTHTRRPSSLCAIARHSRPATDPESTLNDCFN